MGMPHVVDSRLYCVALHCISRESSMGMPHAVDSGPHRIALHCISRESSMGQLGPAEI